MSCFNCQSRLNNWAGQRYVQCRYCGTHNDLSACTPPSLSSRPWAAPPYPNRFSFDAMRGALPHPAGRKRAVICAVSHNGNRGGSYLPGTINDARRMRHVLVEVLNFPPNSILMLNEKETQRHLKPTVKNIKDSLRWLVGGCQSGDSLVFHFSGHGGQNKLYINEDENDGMDEFICALDGKIVDDELNDLIVKPIPRGAKLHAIMDCCNSGTVLDLPFLCEMGSKGRYSWIDHRPRSGAWKGTSGGEVFCFSGCDDDQNSGESDTLVRGTSVGVMTYWFIDAVAQLVYRPNRGITYGHILDSIHFNIGDDERRDAWEFLVEIFHRRPLEDVYNDFRDVFEYDDRPVEQVPQLTASSRFDVYNKRFTI